MKNVLLIDEKCLFLIGEKSFCSSVKRERGGFVFALAKNGNECDPKILLFVLVFSIYLFSNTDRCFCLFVCLFVYARARKHT